MISKWKLYENEKWEWPNWKSSLMIKKREKICHLTKKKKKNIAENRLSTLKKKKNCLLDKISIWTVDVNKNDENVNKNIYKKIKIKIYLNKLVNLLSILHLHQIHLIVFLCFMKFLIMQWKYHFVYVLISKRYENIKILTKIDIFDWNLILKNIPRLPFGIWLNFYFI